MSNLINTIDNCKRFYHKEFVPQLPQTQKYPIDKFVIQNKINGFNNYKMFNQNGEILGTMQAIPERVDTPEFYPANDCYYSFYINRLDALKRNNGVGRSFIKIARKESYRNACEGRVHLIAKNPKDIYDKPDIFYRKCGFDSSNKYHIEKIDEAIKNNKPLENLWQQTLMYLPLKKSK